MATVTVKGGEFAFGSAVVTIPSTQIALVDSISGVGGDGSYVISLTSGGALIVSRINGDVEPNETPTQVNLASITVARNGASVFANDKRNRQVSHDTVNQAIMHQANADGSPVRDSMVTPRTFSPAAIAFILASGNVQSGSAFPTSPTPGQRFYRTDLNQLYVYQGGTWVAIAGATGTTTTSFPGSPFDGEIVYRSDLSVLYIYSHGAWIALGGSNGIPGAGIIIGTGPPGALSAQNGTIYEDRLNGGLDYIATDTPGHGTYSSDQLSDGAIAQWPLADTSFGIGTAAQTKPGSTYAAGDYASVGNTAAASLIGDQPHTASFTQANDNSANLPFSVETLSRWSVEFVMNPTSGFGSTGCAVAGDDHSDVSNKGIECVIADSPSPSIAWEIGTGSAHFAVGPYIAGAAFTGATTYHVVLTYDGTSYRFYVNGALVSTVAGAAPSNPGGGFTAFGHTPNIVTHYGMNGRNGGVGLYSTVLSGAQIAAHYADLAATTPGPTTTAWNAILTAGGAGSGVASVAVTAPIVNTGTPTAPNIGFTPQLAIDTDVVISSPANNDVLTYETSSTKWKNKPAAAGSSTLAADTDVLLASPANNDVLTFETSSSKWKNKPASGGSVWRSGSGVPSSGLGANGDYYLNTTNGDVYGPKTGGSWGSPIENLTGATGATGAAGGITTFNARTGAIVVAGSASVTVTESPTNTFTLTAPGGGSSGPPYAFVQSSAMPYTHNNNPTLTFPKTATSGNTLFLLVNYAASVSAMTTPTGWTAHGSIDASDTQSHLILYTKVSAGTETSITLAGNAYYSAMFWELPGSRTVTIHTSAAGTAGTDLSGGGILACPSFTPSSGAMAFAACGSTHGTIGAQGWGHQVAQPMDSAWKLGHVSGPSDNPRAISCYVYQAAAPGTAIMPPAWSFYDLYSLNMAYDLFSVT